MNLMTTSYCAASVLHLVSGQIPDKFAMQYKRSNFTLIGRNQPIEFHGIIIILFTRTSNLLVTK